MAEAIILETKELTKSFGGLVALNSVNLKVISGSCTSIIGPNGAGKTTFFNVISGYYPPTAGKVIFCGSDISKSSIENISRQGIVRAFQHVSIFPKFTAYENVLMAYLSYDRKTHNIFASAKTFGRQQTEKALKDVNLENQSQNIAAELSVGDRKRLELAMTVVQQPKLLLLDEPTAGMSPKESDETINLVLRLAKKRDLTVLFTEHDMRVVFSMSETVRVMHLGKLIAEGSGDEIKANDLVRKVYLGESG